MDGWDGIAYRRPKGDPHLPVFICAGDAAETLMHRYRDRLISGSSGHNTPVPHAWVEDRLGDEGVEDVSFFDHIADGLVETFPKAMGKLRLNLYWTVRDVLDVALAERDHNARKRELSKLLFERRRKRASGGDAAAEMLKDTAESLKGASGEPWYSGVVSLLGQISSYWLRMTFALSVRRRRSRDLGKLIAQAAKVENKGLLAAAQRIVHNGKDRQNHELVRRTLVLALLLDLDAATTRSLTSPRRRRRTTPFVLLLPSVSVVSDGAAGRFLQTYRAVVPSLERGTTLILASAEPSADTTDLSEEELAELPLWLPREFLPVEHARMLIDAVMAAKQAAGQPARMTSQGLVGVEVPTSQGRGEEFWLTLYDRVVAHPGIRPRITPVALFIAVCLGICAISVFGAKALADPPPCAGVSEASASEEHIGLGDGNLSCTFFPAPRNEVEEAMKDLEHDIATENQTVLDAVDDEEYVEVVFFAPLTTLDKPAHSGYSSLRELRGIHLAQKVGNKAALKDDSKRVPVVVRLANAGDSFAHGPAVAQDIVKEAEENDRIVGVVGISQSREKSQQAIGILGEAGLPVIGGTTTADEMIYSSESYYQIAPQNERIASMMATFVHHHPTIDVGEVDAEVARDAVIVMDHSDEYSENLSVDIYRQFAGNGHDVKNVYSYAVEDESQSLPDYNYNVTQAGSLGELAADICRDLDLSRDIVFFTARSTEFAGLLGALKDETDCETGSRPITIVAGDTLTRIVQDPSVNLGEYRFLRLYYAALAAPSMPIEGLTIQREFVERYKDLFDGADGDVAVDISDPALDYDALTVLQKAAKQINESGRQPTRQLIAAEFDHGQIEHDGVTGYLNFGSTDDEDRVPHDKPVLIIDALASGQPPLLICGRFTEELNVASWGPQGFPCPEG